MGRRWLEGTCGGVSTSPTKFNPPQDGAAPIRTPPKGRGGCGQGVCGWDGGVRQGWGGTVGCAGYSREQGCKRPRGSRLSLAALPHCSARQSREPGGLHAVTPRPPCCPWQRRLCPRPPGQPWRRLSARSGHGATRVAEKTRVGQEKGSERSGVMSCAWSQHGGAEPGASAPYSSSLLLKQLWGCCGAGPMATWRSPIAGGCQHGTRWHCSTASGALPLSRLHFGFLLHPKVHRAPPYRGVRRGQGVGGGGWPRRTL